MRKCTVQVVADVINRLAPRRLAEDWDNPGLLIGEPSAEAKKIFVCLDVTDEKISKAIELDAQLIVAHHPLIFHAIKNVRFDLPLGKKISRLIKNNLASRRTRILTRPRAASTTCWQKKSGLST